jgi:mannose-6-phosphate isomerase-like protein (cupin superfamily)
MEQSYWFLGIHLTVLADCHATKGCYDLLECASLPGLATPWARHTMYDMQLLVLAGELTVHTAIDANALVLTAGQSWLIPKGVGHCVINSGTEVANSLVLASPSGFAQLIRSTGTFAEAGSLPPPVRPNFFVLAQAAAEVGDELLATGLIANHEEPPRPVDACCSAYSTESYLHEFMYEALDYSQPA